MNKILLSAFLVLFSLLAWAGQPAGFQLAQNDFIELESSWKGGFYTDDSRYFMKIKNDGFLQRIRFERDYCSNVDGVSIVFKKVSKNKGVNVVSRKISLEERGAWPVIYGSAITDYCWFEVEASGMNLNMPSDNQYALKIQYLNKDYFYGAMTDSLLPGKRIVEDLSKVQWISFGPNGATPVNGGGVFYKIWEPTVDDVSLFINDRNNGQKMIADSVAGTKSRSFVLYVPSSKPGDRYIFNFFKDGKVITSIVSNELKEDPVKVDPMARLLVYDKKGGAINGYKNPWAQVQGLLNYTYRNDQNILTLSDLERSNRIIYQLWPLTFNPKKVNGKYVGGTFKDIVEKIPYLSELGINAVEFLPINEGRFDAGWGYALDSVQLIQTNYGTPEDLMALVDGLHGKGVQVIFDIVINHVNNSLIRDPVGRYNDQSKYYSGTTDWGPKPRYADINVQRWLLDSILSMVYDYHPDGLRFDMTKYIYNLGGSSSGYRFLQELNYILKKVQPKINLSAEELPNNLWMSKPQRESGAGFDAQWNDKFKNAFEDDFSRFRSYSADLNLTRLVGALYGYSGQTSYGQELIFSNPNETVNYLGSHDFVGNKNPILRLVTDYNFYERADNNYFLKVRPVEEQNWDRFRIIHNEFSHSVGKAAYGILFTKPGNLLFYQGEELANDIKITNEWSYINARENNSIPSQDIDINRYVGSHRVPWEYIDPYNSPEMNFVPEQDKKLFTGYHKYFKDMIRFRKAHPGFNLQNAYEVQLSPNGQVLTYQIDDGKNQYFIVVNFALDRNGEWVSFPAGGNSWWFEVSNSSAEQYSTEGTTFRNLIAQAGGRNNHLRLKANTTYVFQKSSKGLLVSPLFFRSNLNNWSASENFKLVQSSEHGDVYSALINVSQDGEYEFKIANNDWSFEIGTPLRGSNVEVYGNDVSGQMTNMSAAPNVKVFLKKGSYRFLFSINDYKFNFAYQGKK